MRQMHGVEKEHKLVGQIPSMPPPLPPYITKSGWRGPSVFCAFTGDFCKKFYRYCGKILGFPQFTDNIG